MGSPSESPAVLPHDLLCGFKATLFVFAGTREEVSGMIEGISLFQTVTNKMSYMGVRHTLLAQNVAHADTPDYKAQDLKPFSESLRTVQATNMMATHGRHMVAELGNTSFREEYRVEGWEVEPSGNQVSLEEQMIKSADNSRDYQLATQLMKKHAAMLKATLSTRG
jgi:flagellar basal-body rod protein FlgB